MLAAARGQVVTSRRPGTGAPLRVFVYPQGYLIIQTADEHLQDYPLRYAPCQLLLRGPDGRPDTLHYAATPAGLRLTGRLGPDSVR